MMFCNLKYKKAIFISVLALIFIGFFFFVEQNKFFSVKDKDFKSDFLTFSVEGGSIKFSKDNKKAVSAEFGSFEIVREDTVIDLNGDGHNDKIAILSHSGEGGWELFYLAVELSDNQSKYSGTNVLFIGDRIDVQRLEVDGNKIIAYYLDRAEDEPMAMEPRYLKYFEAGFNANYELVNKKVALEYDDKIRVNTVNFGSRITSPLILSGEARGNWFFEASFPIVLTDQNGEILAEGHAEAQSDWMTNEFVPYKAELNFSLKESSRNGFLILKKDNPSGLAEYDNAFVIEVDLGA